MNQVGAKKCPTSSQWYIDFTQLFTESTSSRGLWELELSLFSIAAVVIELPFTEMSPHDTCVSVIQGGGKMWIKEHAS